MKSRTTGQRVLPATGLQESAQRLQVRTVMARARALVERDRLAEAIHLLEPAIPDIVDARLRHGAQVLLAQALTRNPKSAHRAEAVLRAVIEEDPHFVSAFAALCEIYRARGLEARAEAMSRKAEALTAALGAAAPSPPRADAPARGSMLGALRRILGRT